MEAHLLENLRAKHAIRQRCRARVFRQHDAILAQTREVHRQAGRGVALVERVGDRMASALRRSAGISMPRCRRAASSETWNTFD